MVITKAKAKEILMNTPLIDTLKMRLRFDAQRNDLINARIYMESADVERSAIDSVQRKVDEYTKIRNGYSVLLEDTFGLRWQDAAVIRHYLDIAGDVDAIDRLPDAVREK